MKAIFNCSKIMNVELRKLKNEIMELEIQFTDQCHWTKRKSLNSAILSTIQEFENAYEDIKKALLDGDKFVSIEIE